MIDLVSQGNGRTIAMTCERIIDTRTEGQSGIIPLNNGALDNFVMSFACSKIH